MMRDKQIDKIYSAFQVLFLRVTFGRNLPFARWSDFRAQNPVPGSLASKLISLIFFSFLFLLPALAGSQHSLESLRPF